MRARKTLIVASVGAGDRGGSPSSNGKPGPSRPKPFEAERSCRSRFAPKARQPVGADKLRMLLPRAKRLR